MATTLLQQLRETPQGDAAGESLSPPRAKEVATWPSAPKTVAGWARSLSGAVFEQEEIFDRHTYNSTVRLRMAYFAPACTIVCVTMGMGSSLQTFASVFNGMETTWAHVFLVFLLIPSAFTVFVYMAEMSGNLALDGMARPPLQRFRATLIVGAGLTPRTTDGLVMAAIEIIPFVSGVVSWAFFGQTGGDFVAGYMEAGLVLCGVFAVVTSALKWRIRRKGLRQQFLEQVHVLNNRFLGDYFAEEMNSAEAVDLDRLVHVPHPEPEDFDAEALEEAGGATPLQVARKDMFYLACGMLCLLTLIPLVKWGVVGFKISLPIVCLSLLFVSMVMRTAAQRQTFRILTAIFFFLTVSLALLSARGEPTTEELKEDFLVPPAHHNGTGPRYTAAYHSGAYPVCLLRWGHLQKAERLRLTAIDLVAVSEAMYSLKRETIEKRMATDFKGTHLENLKVVDMAENYEAIGRWAVVEFPESKVRVFVVRGTLTTKDILADVDMYGSVAIMQVFDHILPVTRLFPERTIRNMLAFLVIHAWLGEKPLFSAALDRLGRLKEESAKDGYQVVVTGHSLGGAIAAIVGSRQHLPTLAVSPPGTLYSAQRFLTSRKELTKYLTVIQPDHDVVSQIDEQVGFVQNIRCRPDNPMKCHILGTTVQTLYDSCGDPRGRTLR